MGMDVLVVAGLAVTGACWAIVRAIKRIAQARHLRDHGQSVSADVLWSTVGPSDPEVPATRLARVTFRPVAGGKVTKTLSFPASWMMVGKGDVLQIRYDPARPQDAVPDRGDRQTHEELRGATLTIVVAALVALTFLALIIILSI